MLGEAVTYFAIREAQIVHDGGASGAEMDILQSTYPAIDVQVESEIGRFSAWLRADDRIMHDYPYGIDAPFAYVSSVMKALDGEALRIQVP